MRRRAPAVAGAVTLVCLAACSSHVDVGLSRDPPPARPDAGEGGSRTDAGVVDTGVTRTEPSTEETRWARLQKP
jgi:hypothetical protein